MRIYRIAMINSRLNLRQFLEIEATSCIEAGGIARKKLGKEGYDLIESITCIEWRRRWEDYS